MMPLDVRMRVQAEHDDLLGMRLALLAFLDGPKAEAISPEARRRLQRQEAHMLAYQQVLAERLAED